MFKPLIISNIEYALIVFLDLQSMFLVLVK